MPVTKPHAATAAAQPFDVERVRAAFPVLQRAVYEDQPLVYLDSAATSQKPQAVIDRLQRYYAEENSNVHRGVHRLSQVATDAYEDARRSVAALINAPDPSQVILTRGTTEGINLVASSYGRTNLSAGDEILLSAMEQIGRASCRERV
jgi:cysteine desulfurase / selenocysteine lyase